MQQIFVHWFCILKLSWIHWWILIVSWWHLQDVLYIVLHYLQTVAILLLSFQYGCLLFIWASLVAQLVKNPLAMLGRPGFNTRVGKIPWRRAQQATPVSCPGEFHGLYSPWGHKESFICLFILSHLIAVAWTSNTVLNKK